MEHRRLRAGTPITPQELEELSDEQLVRLVPKTYREFFPGHPLGMSIAGTPETVRSFSHELTRKYHEKTFNASNLIIAAAGNVDHQALVDLVTANERFSNELTVTQNLTREPKPAAPIVIEQKTDLEQAHLPIARLDRFLQPFERTLRISEADVHIGETKGGWIPRLRDTPQFVERRKRLVLASSPCQDVSGGGDDIGARS